MKKDISSIKESARKNAATAKLVYEANEYQALPSVKAKINVFIKYYKTKGKSISEYTEEDFAEFFQQNVKQRQTYAAIKSNIAQFLSENGYINPSAILRATKYETSDRFIPNLDYIERYIQKVKIANGNFNQLIDGECDIYTTLEMVVYLAWIGVPLANITDIKLSDVDFQKKQIHLNGSSYSFDVGDLPKLFYIYRGANVFIAKIQADSPAVLEYKGLTFLRNKNDGINKYNTVHTVFEKFPELISYINVYQSGIFYRAYFKYQELELPNFKSVDDAEHYFGACPKSVSGLQAFKQDWADYVEWRKSLA